MRLQGAQGCMAGGWDYCLTPDYVTEVVCAEAEGGGKKKRKERS